MTRPFRERDPLKLTIAGLLVGTLLVAGSLVVPQAFFYARTTDYAAELANAAGLQVDDQVHIAGVPAGRVTELGLAGDRVLVRFRLNRDQPLGEATRAAVKIQTILGKRYLSVEPAGGGRLDGDRPIPLARTSVPYSLQDLAGSAEKTTAELDLERLRTLVRTLRAEAPDPRLTGEALRGVTAVSEVFTKHSKQFGEVLAGAQKVTDTLLSQQGTLVTLLGDANIVASTLAEHRGVIRALINDVNAMSRQLIDFLRVNKPVIDPLVRRFDVITASLVANEQALSRTLNVLAPGARYLANATGNGPWLDVTAPAGPIPDNALCAVGLVKGCR
ncbi:phospholipid/cholesterol/gamma-HCH transport system substrate-binding protein [Herbihabitans rhizosphaerae]|uniref:Phospholipid/cholesterol/gamma-HCH transport system substrate-binding protein n=1 Tax=Herbihabitans rhizosphaerae TaxID=1872711 RepID=A0A4Q7KD14_9PSEU|nr:MCE family protein [Herbihabitans rhizosphaerae]RZS31225.1 phospholipid/cholesterol/gamma-HCH transport system substrate-binding protein [Herbihabitans rhizosphaerae]